MTIAITDSAGMEVEAVEVVHYSLLVAQEDQGEVIFLIHQVQQTIPFDLISKHSSLGIPT